MFLCLVFVVYGAMMPERCCMGVVINDKSLHYLPVCEETIIEIHLCLINPSQSFKFPFLEESVARWPLVLEDCAQTIDPKHFIVSGLFRFISLIFDKSNKVFTIVDGNSSNRICIFPTVLMAFDHILKKFIRPCEDIHIDLLKIGRKFVDLRPALALFLRKRFYLRYLQHIGILAFLNLALSCRKINNLALYLMHLVYLIGDEQFIAMDDKALSHDFILLEASLGQCSIYIVNVILPFEIAVPHEPVLADSRKATILIVLFNEIGLEQKIPPVYLIAFPLRQNQMTVIVNGDTEPLEKRLRLVCGQIDLLKMPGKR